MLNRILTLALMLSVVICCIFVFTEDPPELEQTGPLPILMYHDVTDGPTSDNPMVVTTEKLEGDLCWLKENGYHTILPRELTAGEPLPEPPTTSTFLFRAFLGSGGRLDIISRSVLVRMMLSANLGAMNGSISLAVPHRAEPYSTPWRYFLAFLPRR